MIPRHALGVHVAHPDMNKTLLSSLLPLSFSLSLSVSVSPVTTDFVPSALVDSTDIRFQYGDPTLSGCSLRRKEMWDRKKKEKGKGRRREGTEKGKKKRRGQISGMRMMMMRTEFKCVKRRRRSMRIR